MKVLLEFNLPEDAEEHADALKGPQWKWALHELVEHLRNERKHVDHSIEEYRMLDDLRDKVYQILQERDLRFW